MAQGTVTPRSRLQRRAPRHRRHRGRGALDSPSATRILYPNVWPASSVAVPRTPRRSSMSQTDVQPVTGARTGRQYLDGLGSGGARDLARRGEGDPSARASAAARRRRSRWRASSTSSTSTPSEMLAPSPDDPALRVNVTHLIPRSRDRPRAPPARVRARRRQLRRDHGPHARLPQRHLRLLRRAAPTCGRAAATSAGADNLVAYQTLMRDRRPLDDARADEPDRRQEPARGRAGGRRGRAPQGRRDRRRASSCAARGCSRRSRRSPTSS